TETAPFPFATGGEKAKGQEPRLSGGRGFKWREPRHSLGRKPFKPQTALLRCSRAVGQSRCPAKGGSAHALRALCKERVSAKGARSKASCLVWNATFRAIGRSATRGTVGRAPNSFGRIRAERWHAKSHRGRTS